MIFHNIKMNTPVYKSLTASERGLLHCLCSWTDKKGKCICNLSYRQIEYYAAMKRANISRLIKSLEQKKALIVIRPAAERAQFNYDLSQWKYEKPQKENKLEHSAEKPYKNPDPYRYL